MSRHATIESNGSTLSTTSGTAPDGLLDAVTTLMRGGRVPGLSLAVVDRDRQLLATGFGEADLATATPAIPSTAYLWFSMSKIVSSTAALRLAEDGRLDLDAPVGEYVDYLRAPGQRQPTIRQLLNHTAGLGNPLPIRWAHVADATPPDPEALLRRLMSRRHAYRYPVGAAARYTNLGYLAAGQVITAAAGQPLQTYIQQAVLDPVGMTRTGFIYQPDADAATGYVRSPKVADPVLRRILPAGVAGSRHGRYLGLNRFHVDGPAYGGLVGDVLDAGRFLRMHLGDGQIDGHRVLKPATTRAMRHLDQKGKPFDHGLGWFRRPTTGRGDWVEHFGAGAGFWNVMRLYPDRGLGVVVMTNSTTTYDFDLHAATWTAPDRYEIRPDARRFENWETNYAAKIGLGVAVEYALSWGLEAIETRVTGLADRLREMLTSESGVNVHDQGRRRCGIITFTVDGIPAQTVQQQLCDRGVNVSVSLVDYARFDLPSRGLGDLVRASVHYYNTDDELDQLIKALPPPN